MSHNLTSYWSDRMNYEGKKYPTNEGDVATVIQYKNSQHVLVEFTNGYRTVVVMGNLKKGKVKNPTRPSVYGVGFIGEGVYKTCQQRKHTKPYRAWKDMLRRCYGNGADMPTYHSCEVCEEWHNFQNFAKWHEDNYYEIEGEEMHLDKDWLKKGNKMYSPDTCVFAPRTINELLVNKRANRGWLPVGVYESHHLYGAKCSHPWKSPSVTVLGTFATPAQAFRAYKHYKEQVIKEVAEYYKPHIPSCLYEGMINYNIEITD